MTIYRRRGLPITVYRTKTVTDSRGNSTRTLDLLNPHVTKAWTYPQRSARAEVPGQQHIDVTRIGVDVLEDVDLWGRVEFLGKTWDIVTPPAYHHGSRHTRHYSIDLRERTVADG